MRGSTNGSVASKILNVKANPACRLSPPQLPRSRARYPPGLRRRGRIRNEKRTRVRIAAPPTDPRLSPRPYHSASQRPSQKTSVQPPCARTTTYKKRGLSPRTPGWSGPTNEDRYEKSGCPTPLRVPLKARETATKNRRRSGKYSSPNAHVPGLVVALGHDQSCVRAATDYNPLLSRIFSRVVEVSSANPGT
jgi:hypothetical protein